MLNRKMIGLLALLLSAGLSLSACGDDDAGKKDNNTNNTQPDAGDEGDTAGEGDTTGEGDATGDADTSDPETGCEQDTCAEGYECNAEATACVPAPTGCDLTGEDRPARCDEAPADAEFGPSSIVTAFRIAESDENCCFDLNGNGEPDNALSIVNSLGDVNGGIQGSIESGSLVLLFEHDGLDDLANSSPYTLNVWLGESVEAPVTGPFVIDPTSVDQGTHPQASLPNAKIENGVLTAGPGIVDISVSLEGLLDAPLSLRISKAQIEATVDASSTLEDGVVIKDANPALNGGKLGGAVRVDDLVSAVNSFAAASCECLGLEGADFVNLEGVAPSCADTPNNTCEADSTCASLTQACGFLPTIGILVDVDTDGDGEDDALSIGTTFDTDAAKISGIGSVQ
ncbi:hypothetical protein [Bradymonas sediminis]|uniref:hypothetical protein n=1 Tax=Bradymonas sediminis TaxID=1548548 RepID=UPI00105BDB77|nr:hypothetical protein [Bradymonas sediminis]